MIILVFLIYRVNDTKSALLYHEAKIIDEDYMGYFILYVCID